MTDHACENSGKGSGNSPGESPGYRCAACGNTETFRALKPYWQKVEINAHGMVLETHGIQFDGEELEEIECEKCGAVCRRSDAPPWRPSRYRCLTCGNETEFHRFYVEEAKERLTEDGDWEILEAWEFADGGETTFGAICTPCDVADRDSDVEEVYPADTGTEADADLETTFEED